MPFIVKALTDHEMNPNTLEQGYHCGGRFWPCDRDVVVDTVSDAVRNEPYLKVEEFELEPDGAEVDNATETVPSTEPDAGAAGEVEDSTDGAEVVSDKAKKAKD